MITNFQLNMPIACEGEGSQPPEKLMHCIEREAGVGRRMDEKYNFVCQRDQERDPIVRQSKITTSVADAIFDSKYKSVPSIPSSQPLSTLRRNY